MSFRPLLACLAFAASAASLCADGLIIIRRPPPRPHPWPHPVFAPLEVAYHKVDVAIDGQKATTHVDQEFLNPNDATLEGDYVFPIPKGAHIDKFVMRVGDRDMEAELLDATKARAIYEEIVRQQRDPALLEYAGRGAFRVRIFPIEPHSRKRVQLTYTELLTNDAGVVSYLYPLNTEKFSAEPLKTASITVKLSEASPLKALYSPSHAVEIRRDGEKRATVSWETSLTRPDRDFQLLFSTADSEVGVSLLAHREGDEGSFVLLAAPGAEKRLNEKPNPKDVVFVVDTSGSMSGNKIAQARKALAFCVENLNDEDRFELVRFSTDTERCFEKLTSATRESRENAARWIDKLRPLGGTAIYDALQEALKLRPESSARPFVVIFLTDGQPTVGESNEDKIAASVTRDGGAPTRIFCFGIGTDVNTHLLDKIVERTRAASQFVLPDEDLEIKVSAFFTKIREPLLTDLKITWPDGVRVTQAYPHPLPDLFRGDQLVLAGRYTGTGEGDVVIEGLVNGRPRRIVQRVKFPARAEDNAFIPQLWAARRIGFLLDEIRLRGDHAELRDEVVQLARRYAIVTPYTSYLIVEDEARRNVPLAQRSFQTLDGDARVRGVLRDSFSAMEKDKVGDAAALNARANASLKSAERADDAVKLSAFEVRRSFGGGYGSATSTAGATTSSRGLRDISASAPAPALAMSAAPTEPIAKVEAAQNAGRVVGGKTFFQNGAQWIDAETQHRKPAKTVKLQFGSDEYFRLLAEQPAAAAWLALGRNVQFTLGDTFYDVSE